MTQIKQDDAHAISSGDSVVRHLVGFSATLAAYSRYMYCLKRKILIQMEYIIP